MNRTSKSKATMLEFAKLIHEAIGIQNPKIFVAVFAIVGLLLFGTVGWLVDKGYREKLRQESEVHQSISPATATEPQKPMPPQNRNATTTGDKSPAVTGNANSITYEQPPDSKNPKSRPPK